MNVSVVEMLPYPLQLAFDEEFCSEAQGLLEERGIDVLTEAKVEAFLGDGAVSGVRLGDGTELDNENSRFFARPPMGTVPRQSFFLTLRRGLVDCRLLPVPKSMALLPQTIAPCRCRASPLSPIAPLSGRTYPGPPAYLCTPILPSRREGAEDTNFAPACPVETVTSSSGVKRCCISHLRFCVPGGTAKAARPFGAALTVCCVEFATPLDRLNSYHSLRMVERKRQVLADPLPDLPAEPYGQGLCRTGGWAFGRFRGGQSLSPSENSA